MTRRDSNVPCTALRAGTGEQLSLLLPLPVDDAQSPAIEVRAHPRSRRISVRIDASGRVRVTTPRRTSARTVEQFLAEHNEWILRTWRDMRPRVGTAPPDEILLPLTLTRHPVRYRVDASRRAGWRRHQNDIEIVTAVESIADRRALLRRWLLAEARRRVPGMLAPVIEQTGLTPRRVQFRLQRSRWGSCSSTGTVSLNASLLFLQPRVAHYLFVHELCHLRHLNHSRTYWSLVRRFVPDCRALDRALDIAWREVPGWTTPD